MSNKIAFSASRSETAQQALGALSRLYGAAALDQADVIVALGGDGHMLRTLHETQHLRAPVYGMNCGTIGFLMNEYREDGLLERLDAAEREDINPLKMTGRTARSRRIWPSTRYRFCVRVPRQPACPSMSTVECGWRNWFATARWWRHPRGRRPTIIRPMVRSCP